VAFEFGEVGVAGGEGGFAIGGQGGGEAVGVGEFMAAMELGCEFGEFVAGVDQFDGQLRDVGGDLAGHAGPFGAPDGIIDLAPVDYAHQELAFAFGGVRDELFDFGGAGTAVEESHEGAGVQDDAFHDQRSGEGKTHPCKRRKDGAPAALNSKAS